MEARARCIWFGRRVTARFGCAATPAPHHASHPGTKGLKTSASVHFRSFRGLKRPQKASKGLESLTLRPKKLSSSSSLRSKVSTLGDTTSRRGSWKGMWGGGCFRGLQSCDQARGSLDSKLEKACFSYRSEA